MDPIDGTKNFVRRIPYWATLLALEEEGEVTLGVVHAPVTGEMFWARRGQGAWADGAPLRVSAVDRLADAMLVHSSLNLLRSLEDARSWDGLCVSWTGPTASGVSATTSGTRSSCEARPSHWRKRM